jgi:phenylacetate-CoA ligase
MPLVRYDTGDLAIVPASATAKEEEEIALGLSPFFGIAGRCDEFVLSPEGLRITGLNQIPREVARLLQVQVIQEPCGFVVVQALVRPGFGDADRAKLMANIQAKIPPAMPFRLKVVERLATTLAGKTPFVIRRAAVAHVD